MKVCFTATLLQIPPSIIIMTHIFSLALMSCRRWSKRYSCGCRKTARRVFTGISTIIICLMTAMRHTPTKPDIMFRNISGSSRMSLTIQTPTYIITLKEIRTLHSSALPLRMCRRDTLTTGLKRITGTSLAVTLPLYCVTRHCCLR